MKDFCKRAKKIEQLRKEHKELKPVERTPCNNCGGKKYLVFDYPSVHGVGLVCATCGTWKTFEGKKKKKKKTVTKPKQTPEERHWEYKRYLLSEKWAKIRRMLGERDGYNCMKCGKYCGRSYEVHHKHYRHIFNEDKHLDCVICICHECHRRISEKQKVYTAAYNEKKERLNAKRRAKRQEKKQLIAEQQKIA